MPRLILTSPEFQNQSCDLPDGTFTVGRSKKNHIVIREDSVSQEHCELLVYGPEVIVRERGSRNGTFVNGARVKAQSGVRHGESLRFGKVEARVEIPPPEGGESTALTALHEYKTFLRDEGQSKASRPKFPVIFNRAEAPPDHAATATGITPLPLAQSETVAPVDVPPSSTASRRKTLFWIGLAILSIIAAWIIHGLWKG